MIHERPDLKDYAGKTLTVIAWLWVRTVKSPNPAFSHIDVPLASTFVLSNKPGKQSYVEPIIENGTYHFTVKVGNPPDEATAGTKAARGANFRCIMSQIPIEPQYIKAEAMAGRMGAKLMAIVGEGDRSRVYLAPNSNHEIAALSADPKESASSIHVPIANDPRALWCLLYGLNHFDHLFTSRQLVALTTFSDLLRDARATIRAAAIAAGLPDDDEPLANGGKGARAYGEAISVYLACGISRSADFWSNLCIWANQPKNELVSHVFGRQALPMAWDFAEANPFSESGGNFTKNLDYVVKGIACLPAKGLASASQLDAASRTTGKRVFVSTDPPYYDNIGYADLSDYFYVWLRRSLREVYPELLATISVPKAEELIATPYRHGTKQKAEKFFLDGMTQSMRNLAANTHPAAPISIFYAFKQSETESNGTNSTGWETFLV